MGGGSLVMSLLTSMTRSISSYKALYVMIMSAVTNGRCISARRVSVNDFYYKYL